jgi:hypothetical protein
VGSVLFGYAVPATGVTSLVTSSPRFNTQLFVLPFIQLYSLELIRISNIYKHVVDSSTELFLPQSDHDDCESVVSTSDSNSIGPFTKRLGRG